MKTLLLVFLSAGIAFGQCSAPGCPGGTGSGGTATLPTATATDQNLCATGPGNTYVACAPHPFGAYFGGSPTAGTTVYVRAAYACTIQNWTITSDGTATVDIWKLAGTTNPTITNTITASAIPAIASGNSVTSSTLTAWTTSVSAGDLIAINLKIVAGATYVGLYVGCK